MSLAEIDEASAYRLDWLLAIDDVVHEVEAEQMEEAGSGTTPNGGPPGMREVRINYRELAEP